MTGRVIPQSDDPRRWNSDGQGERRWEEVFARLRTVEQERPLLTGRVATLEDEVATLRIQVAALQTRVAALEAAP